jgi:hypothetical protein
MTVRRTPPRDTPDAGAGARRPDRAPANLEEVLSRLPRERVSDDFTARVVEAARGRRPGASAAPGRLIAPLALAGALAAAAFAGFLLAPRLGSGSARPPLERSPAARADARAAGTPAGASADREAEALRLRMLELERQLADLQRLAAGHQPLVAIEGDHADYLIDLRDFLPTTREGRAVPAGFAADRGHR